MKKIGRPIKENKSKNGVQSFERNYTQGATLRKLKTIPEKPIGYLINNGDIIQITDDKGNIDVNNFILMYGTSAPKFGVQKADSDIKTHAIPRRF